MTKRTHAIFMGLMIGSALAVITACAVKADTGAALAAPAIGIPAGCFIGGSTGVSASATKTITNGVTIDLGSNAPHISAEVGCRMALQTFTLGAIARYDLTNMSTQLNVASLKQNGRAMLLGTLGYALNANTDLYAVGGIATTKFTLQDIATDNTYGWVMGGGIDMSLGASKWNLFSEYNYITYKGHALADGVLKPSESILRVGLRYGF